MVAMPVKYRSDDPPLTTVFGKAKWFAFVDEDGSVRIEANPYAGAGPKTVAWLLEKGVERIVTQHIGGNPFMILEGHGVKLFYPGEGRLCVSEATAKLRDGACELITRDNIARFIHH